VAGILNKPPQFATQRGWTIRENHFANGNSLSFAAAFRLGLVHFPDNARARTRMNEGQSSSKP